MSIDWTQFRPVEDDKKETGIDWSQFRPVEETEPVNRSEGRSTMANDPRWLDRQSSNDPMGTGASEIMDAAKPSPSIFDNPALNTPTGDPMLRPEFINSFRETLGSLPLEKRLAALQAYATTDKSVYGRAAKVILADAEYQNAKVTAEDRDFARRFVRPGDSVPPSGKKAPKGQAPTFPEATPAFYDDRTPEQVATENNAAIKVAEAWDDTTRNTALEKAKTSAKADEWRSPAQWATDIVSAGKQGVLTLAQIPIDVIAPDSEIAASLRTTMKTFQEEESDVLKAQRQQLEDRVKNESGFIGQYAATIAAIATSPALAISEGVKQLPMFLGVLGSAWTSAQATGGLMKAGQMVSPTLALGEAISGGAMTAKAVSVGAGVGGAVGSMIMSAGDAAGNVYEKLTDPKLRKYWEENPDFKQMVSDGKSPDDAISELAKSKARIAAMIAAPLGLLGYGGAESAIVNRGFATGISEVLTSKSAAKIFAKEIGGENVEEGGTQYIGNRLIGTVDPTQDPMEGVAQAAATATMTSAPFAGIAVANENRTPTAPIDRAGEAYARTAFDPNVYDSTIVSPTDTVRKDWQVSPSTTEQRTVQGLADIAAATTVDDAIGAAARATSNPVPEMNIPETEIPGSAPGADISADSIARSFGITTPEATKTTPDESLSTRSIIDAIKQTEIPNVGMPTDVPGVDSAATGRRGDLPSSSVATGAGDVQRGTSVPGLDNAGRVEGTDVPSGAGQRDALTEPTTVWFGRRGDGYQTANDASVAIPGRRKEFPELSWSVEQMPNGRFRLAGYEQTSVPTAKTEPEQSSINLLYSERGNFPVSLKPAIIGAPLGDLNNNPDYTAAKSGDVDAATRVAKTIVSPDVVSKVKQSIGTDTPIIVPVVSLESSGRNKIPQAAAEVLAQQLGLDTTTEIPQVNTPRRTELSGLDRIFKTPEFDGPVVKGGKYVLLDDTLTQGGTFAALASHIEQNGGQVVATVALTGKQYSATLAPNKSTLKLLRDRFGDIEGQFQAATGYGFDALTESEARYLSNFRPASAVRDRILAEGSRRSQDPNQATPGAVDTAPADAGVSTSERRYVGKDYVDLAESGVPFATKREADKARKQQPMLRTVKVEGGFALTDKSEAQIKAHAAAAKRLANAVGTAGVPLSAHEFLAREGGLDQSAMADSGFEKNVKVGSGWLFAGKNRQGLTIEQATEKLKQAGYLQSDAMHTQAYDLIRKSATGKPQYTPDGWDQINQAETETRFADYQQAQQDAALNGEADPFPLPDTFTPDHQKESGLEQADPGLQSQVRALIAQAEHGGIDFESILEDTARKHETSTPDEYNAAAVSALEAAIARGNQDRGEVAGVATPESAGREEVQGLNGQPTALPAEAVPAATQQSSRSKLENDFSLYPQHVVSALTDRGDVKSLYKEAGVSSANSFSELPLSEQASAYASFIEKGAAPVTALPSNYNEWVAKQEQDAENRRMQTERTIRQANGKPFKTIDGAKLAQTKFDAKSTHTIEPVEGGYELRLMPPAAQSEAKRKAEGRESYIEAQNAVVAEMGLGETPEGDINATEEQWAEIDRRVKARLSGEQPASQDSAQAAATRSTPTDTISFAKPVTGPSGHQLVSYGWRWKPIAFVDNRGEDRVKRISNWDEAESSGDTGRDIVHQFTVRGPDGTEQTVSAESALKVLGYTAGSKGTPASVMSAAKTAARWRMAQAETTATLDQFSADKAKVMAMPLPEMPTQGDEKGWWTLGDAKVRQPEGGPIKQERKNALIGAWRDNRLSEMGWKQGLMTEQSLQGKLGDIESKIKRADLKLKNLTGSQSQPSAPQQTPANAGVSTSGVPGIKTSNKAGLPEETKDLVITHNLTAANLLHADKMGGIPVPSLAITKAQNPLDGFGDITLVGPKEMADPKSGTKVYGADIYSPRYPNVTYQFTPNMKARGEAKIKAGMDATESKYIDWSEVERDGARELERIPAVLWQFLKEKGIEPAVTRVQPKELRAELVPFEQSGKDKFDLMQDQSFIDAAWNMRLADLTKLNDGNVEKAKAELAQEKKRVEDRGQFWFARDLANQIDAYRRDMRENGKVDRDATGRAMEVQVRQADLTGELEEYAKGIIQDLSPNERIFRGFTNAGNRKYVPHTLDNVVNILKKDLRGGENFNYGVGSLRAKFTPEFKSVKQIRMNRDRLMTKENFEKVKNEIDAEFWNVARAISPDLSGERTVSIMEDAAKMGVYKAAKSYGYDLSEDAAQKVAEFLGKLRHLPTAYFEAKILRSVDLGEFSGAVVPEGVDAKVIDALKRRGVTDIRTYKRNDQADRAAKIEQMGQERDLLFSQKGGQSQEEVSNGRSGAPSAGVGQGVQKGNGNPQQVNPADESKGRASVEPQSAARTPQNEGTGTAGPNLKLALHAPESVQKIAWAALKRDGRGDVQRYKGNLTGSEAVASIFAKMLGKTLTFYEQTNPGKTPPPNGFVLDNDGTHIFAEKNSTDAPLMVIVHEALHLIPEARKEPLKVGLRKTFREDKYDDFCAEYGYDPKNKDLTDEEIPAMIAQAVAHTKEFWSDLRDAMGNADFSALAKLIIQHFNRILSRASKEFGQDFIDKYMTNEQEARDLLVQEYAQAMREQGLQPDKVVVGNGFKASPKAAVSMSDKEAIGDAEDNEPKVQQKEIPAAVDLATSLQSAQAFAQGATWRTGRDLKMGLQKRALRAAQSVGVNLRTNSDSMDKYLVRVGVKDALYALGQNPNAVGWYDTKTTQALSIAALMHPELSYDENARFAYTWALAVTSNGMKVDKNFELADKVYRKYKSTGKMPTNIRAGQAQAAINKSLKQFNDLVARWDIDNLRKFAQTNFTVGEIGKLGDKMKPGGEHVDVVVKGAAILGPKIGNGFFSNLYGHFDALTMDRWLIRTWGRWSATLLMNDKENTQLARDRLEDAIIRISLNSEERKHISSILGRSISFDSNPDEMARAIQKASMKPELRSAMNETEAGEELRKSGNSLAKYLDQQKEAPKGPNERKKIRRIFRQILSELNKTDQYKNLNMADLQAALWYGEKRLYEVAKEDEIVTGEDDDVDGYADDEAPDYANAAAKIAREKRIPEDKIRTILSNPNPDKLPGSGGFSEAEAKTWLKGEVDKITLEREQKSPKMSRVVFEVAPDPNDELLVERWRSLSAEDRSRISERVMRKIVPKILEQYGNQDSIFLDQTGSYLDDTNPSFAVLLKKSGDSVAIAKAIGYALSQDSMLVISPKAFKGGDETGAVVVNIGNKTAAEVDAIYQTLHAIEADGEKVINGQSTINGQMVILNYSKIPTKALAKLVDSALGRAYHVKIHDVFTAFPEKKDYDYASEQSNASRNSQALRQWLDPVRAEASAALREAVGLDAAEAPPGSSGQAATEVTQTPANAGVSASGIKASNKQTETPEFKRWFGDSKVVDNSFANLLSQPDGVGVLLRDLLAAQNASGPDLNPVQALMLALAKNDKIGRVIVGLVPVDVVNGFAKNGVRPEDGGSNTSMFVNALNTPVSDQVLSTFRGILTGLSTKLANTITTGRDQEVGPALLASDFNLREVGALLSLQSRADFWSGNTGVESVGTSKAAKPSSASLRPPTENFKLSPAALADLLNKFVSFAPHSKSSVIDDLPSAKYIAEQGKPLVVYHSTSSVIDEFRTIYDEDDYRRFGFHVGSLEAASNRIDVKSREDALNKERGGNAAGPSVMPLYAKAENPLRLEENRAGRWGVDDVMNAIMQKAETEGVTRLSPEDVDAFFSDAFDIDTWLGIKPDPDEAGYDIGDGVRYWSDHEDFGPGERSRLLRAFIQQLGYDSIVYNNTFEGGGDSYLLLDATQVKSAIGNSGAFDPTNPDIRYSNRSQRQAAQQQAASLGQPANVSTAQMQANAAAYRASQANTWTMPDDKVIGPKFASVNVDAFLQEWQDGRIDLKVATKAIRDAGQTIREEFDARRAETLFPGRVAYRTQAFLEKEARPLLQAMILNKVDQNELGDFLLARHAPERNLTVATRNIGNPGLQDGGAGRNSNGDLMTTRAARAYIANLDPQRRQILEKLAARVDQITKGTRDLLVAEGLESQDTIDGWEQEWQFYAPLFKDEGLTGSPHPQGSGFSVKGRASKAAMGSHDKVTDILAHVLMQREAAITRAEKNRVGLSLYGMVLAHPNKDFWTVIKPDMSNTAIAAELTSMGIDPIIAAPDLELAPKIKRLNPQTGQVEEVSNPAYSKMANAIVVKMDGEDRVIMFNESDPRAMRLAQNLKGEDGLFREYDIGNSIMAKTTRWIASVNTQYNPVFGMVNMVRDLQGAAFNLNSTPLKGNTAKVLANVPAAIIGIARDLREDNARTHWSDLWLQFQEDGGRTGYKELFKDSGERAEAIEDELTKLEKAGKLSAGKATDAVLDLLSDFNDAIENGVRLSAYKVALDNGMSRAEAAKIARELTVDFNRRGARSGPISGVMPIYAFMNASIQGTARTVETLKSPTGKYIIAGGLALGAVQALMLAAAGYDDDEIPDWVKARSLIIPTTWRAKKGEHKNYIAIPYALGLHVLPNTGRVITELTIGDRKNMGKRIGEAIGEIAGAFSPFGGGNILTVDGALKTALPTPLDPLIEVATNKKFNNAPIEKKPFNEEQDNLPGFTRARERTVRTPTGQAYLGASKALNTVTGGTKYEKGAVSPTPEMIRYTAEVVGGGILRELEKTIDSTVAMVKGEEVKNSGIPLAGRFVGEVDEASVQASRFYENKQAILKAQSSRAAAKKAKDMEGRQEVTAAHPELESYRALQTANEQLHKLSADVLKNVDNPAELINIDNRRTEIMRNFNQQVRELEKRPPTIADTLRKWGE